MLGAKNSAGEAQEVNLREFVICMPLSSVNKAAHSGFKTGVSMGHKKGLTFSKNVQNKKKETNKKTQKKL